MPKDPTLNSLFSHLDDSPTLDVDAVLRRARRRRLPRQLAAGGVLSLAVGGIVVASAYGLAPNNNSNQNTMAGGSSDAAVTESSVPESAADTTGESNAESDATTQSTGGVKRAPADKINLCEGPVSEVAPNARGLELTTHFDDAAAGSEVVTGTVTLTNKGDEPVTGTSGTWVSITVSQDGLTLWHTNGAHTEMSRVVELAPGESMEYDASFEPVLCSTSDELVDSFAADLPALPAGDYQVSAAMDIVIDSNAELVTGPTSTISLD